MYKSEKTAKLKELLEGLTDYSNKQLIFDADDKSHLEILSEAGELARDLSRGIFVPDLNGKKAIEFAKELLEKGEKIQAVYVIKRELGMGLREAKEFVDNGFKVS